MSESLNIGSVAQAAGLPAKTIRYYESIGLIQPAGRRANGYRSYSGADMRTLAASERMVRARQQAGGDGRIRI